MGLFDGRRGTDEASTAHVAMLLGAPVVLVVDARSMSRSVAALVHGFVSYDPRVRVAGVILNQVGSDTHEQMLREFLLRRRGSRSSGSSVGTTTLSPPAGTSVSYQSLNAPRLPCAMVGGCPARRGPLVRPRRDRRRWPQRAASDRRRALAASAGRRGRSARSSPLRAGEAFSFEYAEHDRDCSRRPGATVVDLRPTVDEALPGGTDVLIIGGGFPEEHAGAVRQPPLREAVARLPGRRLRRVCRPALPVPEPLTASRCAAGCPPTLR